MPTVAGDQNPGTSDPTKKALEQKFFKWFIDCSEHSGSDQNPCHCSYGLNAHGPIPGVQAGGSSTKTQGLARITEQRHRQSAAWRVNRHFTATRVVVWVLKDYSDVLESIELLPKRRGNYSAIWEDETIIFLHVCIEPR